jgi:murein L,D-transpeptidase YcbB/YkuD
MIKKIFALFILFFFISCKNEAKKVATKKLPIEDSISSVSIRPIPLHFLKNKKDSIQLLYKKFEEHEIWYDAENRTDLIHEIEYCYKDGLEPEDYNYENILLLEAKRKELTDDAIINYDILLTESFEKLATHLHCGKTKPKDIYTDWDIPAKSIALSNKILDAIKTKTIATFFKEIKPQHSTYVSLKKSLVLLNALPKYKLKKIFITDKIEINDTIPQIILIKEHLSYWKDYKNKDSIITPIYDENTFSAIKKFQRRHGLKTDGVIGNGTIKALNFSKTERREQIYANLERWKWFPENFGKEYLIINIPEYYLAYVVDEDTITKHRVIVGKPKRSTPIISSKLSNFVFNPTWTLPPTIIKEDLTPSATKNREYFNNNRITIYNKNKKEVSAEEWIPEDAKTYRYVQVPGHDNSLGLVKFNFSNRHLVYLHDTNHRDFFVREYRALSSGCVRIEKSLSLAETILKHDEKSKWSKFEIDTIIKNKKTKYVPLNNLSVNIYLFYWTSWSNKEGLQFREDIYNLDKKLYEALRN